MPSIEVIEDIISSQHHFGVRVFVDRYICDSPTFVRWNRKHRKTRINKKWQKKYGAVFKTCPGKAFRIGKDLCVCPHVYEQLKKCPEVNNHVLHRLW